MTIFCYQLCNKKMNPPIKPQESDCCNSGCNPCIFDVYEEQLKRFLKEKHTKNCSLFTFEYVKQKNENTNKECHTLSIIYKPGQHFLLKKIRKCSNLPSL
ncbi:uncharacterized protein LOC143193857 isoform X2 [Rhynchophorus ferrugineus]|uniref:uncharacterized protein LOC143193857 isoform X2 n=1 Tax=Rhynchophorus ferrugineus TaxID=354439 RepID=UPI003FCEB73A